MQLSIAKYLENSLNILKMARQQQIPIHLALLPEFPRAGSPTAREPHF
jgi:hypothetical protein